MADGADLASLQRRFYDQVVSDAASDGLVVSGDLGIYAHMYAARLHDVLADDYPKLRMALGAQPFAALITDYLRAHPPRSFTLRDAGAALSAHLRDNPGATAWAADLAALERARVEAFDGPDATPLAHGDLVALGDQLPGLVLSWVPSSAVVPLASAVDDLWSAIEDDQPVFEPAAEPRTVLVWRRDISVLHRTLDADEAALAPQIAAGVPFAGICEVLGGLHGDQASARAVELLLRWLEAEAVVGSAT
jgi:hypothetical protein